MPDWNRILSKIANRRSIAPAPGSEPKDVPSDPRFARAKLTFPASGTLDYEGRRLRWGLSVGLKQGDGGLYRLRIEGYALDDIHAPAKALRVTDGTDELLIVVDKRRGDVPKALKLPADRHEALVTCGFATEIDVRSDRVKIAVRLEDKTVDLGEAELVPQVLFGREGWLFLTNDANNSPQQFSQDFSPDRAWGEAWSTYFRASHGLTDLPGLKSRSFVIAPSKEEIFPDLYPLPRAGHCMIDEFLQRFSAEPGVLWPAPILREQRELSFDRGETHWTDFGARLTCEALLRNWGLKVPDLPLTFTLRQAAGDLGDKVMPRLMAHRPAASWKNPGKLIFNNFALHHGNIRVWANPEPVIPETLMIFGGSSSDHMIRYFSALFARVVFVYSAGSWDPGLIALEKPARLILQTSQRFLRLPPQPEVNAREIAAEKIRKAQVTCRGDYAQEMAVWTDPSVAALVL